MDTLIDQFLSESNLIEDVDDEKSLYLARKAFNYLLECEVITALNIQAAHRIVMAGKIRESQLGKWRTVDLEPVGFNGPPPPFEKVPALMDNWIQMANLTKSTHPGQHGEAETAEHIKQDHIRFERIHPFADGNGRVGRMLLNWQRIKCGLEPLVILNSEKFDYYEWFI